MQHNDLLISYKLEKYNSKYLKSKYIIWFNI